MDRKQTFKKLLEDNEFVFLDGGTGTMLQNMGMKLGEIPDLLNIKDPEMLIGLQRSYIDAGAMIINASTFSSNRYKLGRTGYTTEEVISAAIAVSRKAAEGRALVALDIGPLGLMVEPTGNLSMEEAYDAFREAAVAGEKAGADLVFIETMTDLAELKAAVLAVRENTELPVMASMSFDANLRTFTGCSVEAMAMTIGGLGVDALGINCSLGPREMYPIVEKLSEWTRVPMLVKPNAGLPDPKTGEYSITAEEFADCMEQMIPLGLKLPGGCCGTTPEFIKTLRERFSKHRFTAPAAGAARSAVCSANRTVVIDQPRIIGERINPTGKKLFKEALKKRDMGYILSQAISQAEAGADILDINVGLPEIDEPEMMRGVVKAVQAVTDVPLQIDSSDPAAVEAGLRACSGKAIVNSVNGEEKSLAAVLPIVKKYGAAVVGLTLDENGIPKTAQARIDIAKRIMDRAVAIGIPKEDIYIDCLTLTASAEQENVLETVRALRRVKEELGLKTVLGVSNISFGLPNRGLINRNFLAMALSYGLDLPIINPNDEEMTGAVRAYKVLAAIDRNSTEYIEAYKDYVAPAPAGAGGQSSGSAGGQASAAGTSGAEGASGASGPLGSAILHGLKDDCARITAEMLETTDSLDIVNEHLIPALDKAGEDFEKGRSFLPQLIMSATAAQASFDEIKKRLARTGGGDVSKGKIVLATVKGDIHDIGKNIVKVLLENYGYEIIDLGRDVDKERVLEAVVENDVHLVGLSALMTTTLGSMADTISLIADKRCDCKVMVGGAVLTPEYAANIGADFYARDAKEAVDIAKKVFG